MKFVLKVIGIIAAVIGLIAAGLVWFYGPTMGAVLTGKPIHIIKPSAKKYGETAIGIMDIAGIYGNSEDWQVAKKKALDDLKGVKSYEETYPIIQEALKSAGGKHSFLISKDESKKSAEEAMMPSVERVDDILILSLPAIASSQEKMKQYANILADGIAENKDAKGVIIDLSNNNGGDMGPMISGLSALIPNGDVMHFVSRMTGDLPVRLDNGQVIGGGSSIEVNRKDKVDLPVAIILGEKTASSGEMTALAFAGLKNAKTFGKSTAGYTTINQKYELYDGAEMALTIGYSKDRQGKEYKDQKLEPEVTTEDAINEAKSWIGKYKE